MFISGQGPIARKKHVEIARAIISRPSLFLGMHPVDLQDF